MLAHAAAFLLLLLGTASASPATGGVQQEPPPPPPPPLEPAALARLQAYLRIDTSQPSPDYEASTAWLLGQAAELGLEATVLRFRPSKPLVLLVWPGADPSLPAVLLNSHTDVVPAEAGRWSHPPFGAHVDPAGRLYARGSQDMKCVGAAYLEAVRRLRGAAPGGAPLLRTLALSFVPDEEIGGKAGMGAFVDSPEFAALNVGVELDEGWASGAGVPTFPAFYAERVPWWFVIRASGEPAHGSVLTDGSAMGRLQGALARVAAFRATQVALVRSGAKQAGEVTSINVVYLRGGVATEAGAPFGEARFAMNVQPGSAEAGLDMRLPPMSAPEMKEAERVLREEWAPAAENLTVVRPSARIVWERSFFAVSLFSSFLNRATARTAAGVHHPVAQEDPGGRAAGGDAH